MQRAVLIVLVRSALLAAIVAGLTMYVAWDHNPQGEFHELAADGSLRIHWLDWTLLGLCGFAVAFTPAVLIGAAIAWLPSLGDKGGAPMPGLKQRHPL